MNAVINYTPISNTNTKIIQFPNNNMGYTSTQSSPFTPSNAIGLTEMMLIKNEIISEIVSKFPSLLQTYIFDGVHFDLYENIDVKQDEIPLNSVSAITNLSHHIVDLSNNIFFNDGWDD